MADKTKISWADASWNPIIGCSKKSAGCVNCYAEKMAHRQAHMEMARGAPDRYGDVLTCDGKWNGDTLFVESALTKPLHWRKPRKIFVVSMGDLVHESVPFEWVLKILGIIIATPWHQYYLLTKRAGRMREFLAPYPDGWLIREGMKYSSFSYEFFAINAVSNIVSDAMVRKANEYWKTNYDQSNRGKLDGPVPHPIPNLHLGVTVENQDNVGRILDLVKTPRAAGFISFEPLLGRIDCPKIDAPGRGPKNVLEDISYAFIGCESGPGARLCTQEDIRHVMRQCRVAGVKIHVKQIPLNGKCNKVIGEWPKEFRIREQ